MLLYKQEMQLLCLCHTGFDSYSPFSVRLCRLLISMAHLVASVRATKAVLATSAAVTKPAKNQITALADTNFPLEHRETLLLTIDALKAQIADQVRLNREQMVAATEERRIAMSEAATQRTRDTERLTAITDQLHHTQVPH